jgi:RNA polymerase sigma factor (sigma-70 family)
MTDAELLAERFEDHRDRLRAVALRMLGSSSQAEDAVQEAWLRLSRTDAEAVDNLGGWLTTVVARVCLDMLRSRAARHETPAAADHAEPVSDGSPEDEAMLADSVGLALLIVLDTLTPPERLAFVLHDLFGVPFDEIAPILGRSPAAARQLASRGRRRVQADPAAPKAAAAQQREVVSAFMAASRHGDFEGLLRLLDPQVEVRADPTVVGFGGLAVVRGPDQVAQTFAGRAEGARLALVDGLAGAVWSVGGAPKVVFDFTVRSGRIVAIDMLGDPDTLAALDLEPQPEGRRRRPPGETTA